MPIVDLMAISSSHFAKLKNFIQMQLPAGFPIKIGLFRLIIDWIRFNLELNSMKNEQMTSVI